MDGADWIIWLDSNQRRQRAHGKVASDTPPLSSLSAPLLLHKAVLVVVRACGRDEMVVLAHHVAWRLAVSVAVTQVATMPWPGGLVSELMPSRKFRDVEETVYFPTPPILTRR
ncbi:unnamed protein product [Hydatigera taeniaeformis]|uniref:Usp domain-containing protein n=1 Tax=Hydatigena taeniaeformis TaxID=6205 RepID=A0A0R3X9I3_HYDTA|nr:unnamed protein product [Hydatigera taeniaeformis]